MVSGKHSKTYDINKIHDFIDNLPFPTEHSPSTYLETHHKLQQKKLFDEPGPTEKKTVSTPVNLTASESFVPHVVVHTKDELQKQEEKTVITQSTVPAPEPLFSKDEPPKVEQSLQVKPTLYDQPTKESPDLKEPGIFVFPHKQPKENPPMGEQSKSEETGTVTKEHDFEKQDEASLPEFEPVDEAPTPSPQNHDWLSGYEHMEIETIWDKNEHKEERPQELQSFENIPPKAKPEADIPKKAPTTEQMHPSPKEERREQKLRQRELKKRLNLERKASKRQEREARRQEKREQKQQKSQSLPTHREPSRLQRQNQILKHARQQERQRKRQEKLFKKNELIATGLRENAYKMKKREDKRLKKSKEREKKHDNAYIISKKAPMPTTKYNSASVHKPQNKETEQRLAQETEERRTLKEIEQDLQKEKENKEKEARKAKAIEEENAKKKMKARFEEERLKQHHSKKDQQIDVFDGFDSIDQATALVLYNHGYTTVERLLSASLEDLMRIGIKKKIAHLICAETKEFVEWKVFDAKEQPESISSPADQT
jgi:hypothetical protein